MKYLKISLPKSKILSWSFIGTIRFSGSLIFCLFLFDLSLGVLPRLPEIEREIWKRINSHITCSRPIGLVYPYPDKFQNWLDNIELNLKQAETLSDMEHKSCFYYYLDEEIENSSLPIQGFPKVLERLENLGLLFKYQELAGGYIYQNTLRKKVLKEFRETVCARLVMLKNLSDAENYTPSKMTIEVIRDANILLSMDSLFLEEKALALLYLAEAYETEWFLYVHPDQSALVDFHTNSAEEARKNTLQTYENLSIIYSPLQDHALNKIKSIKAGEITQGGGRYNFYE